MVRGQGGWHPPSSASTNLTQAVSGRSSGSRIFPPPATIMSAVVDQLIGSALASATTNDNPVAVAFVREGPYAPGCGGFYPLLRGAGAGGRKPIIG